MNTVNCRIKVNEYSTVECQGLTPAEALVVQTIHNKNAGGCCIQSAVPAGEAGENEYKMDRGVKVVAGWRPRTDEEELARLRGKYKERAKSGAYGSHICDDLFGVPGTAVRLPQTFRELPPAFREFARPQPAAVVAGDMDGAAEPSVPELSPAGAKGKGKG